jgi:hypothetical protein
VSSLATRHFQKKHPAVSISQYNFRGNEASVSAGTMDFKKIENLEFLK